MKQFAGLAVMASLAAPSLAYAQPYQPPPSSTTAYWQVPAFSDIALKGPQTAKGVFFWSHGLNGRNPQYTAPPPEIVKDYARAGWDVIKVQRNNLFETTWIDSGLKHVSDLVGRIEKAKRDGYRQVIAGGQSYGGAISLEAAGRVEFFGVMAFAPGHGSDGCFYTDGNYPSRAGELPDLLRKAILASRAQRVVLSLADGDSCMGYTNFNPVVANALAGMSGASLHFGTSMPIRGHGAATTNQFRAWYGRCVAEFLDPDKQPAKQAQCAAPNPVPRYLFPANFAMPQARPGSLIGGWSGTYAAAPRNDFSRQSVPAPPSDLCIVIESETPTGVQALIAFGAGPERDGSMSATRQTMTRDGKALVYRGPDQYRLAVEPAGAGLALSITARNGIAQWTGTLNPGC